MKREDCILYSGGATGSEAAFGAAAQRHGIDEVNFTFEGHNPVRERGRRILTNAELRRGDVGLGIANFPFSDARAFWRWIERCEDWTVDSIWQRSPRPAAVMGSHGAVVALPQPRAGRRPRARRGRHRARVCRHGRRAHRE